MVKRLNVLLIEDNENETAAMKDYASTTKDVHIFAATNSSSKGIEYTKELLPDAVILDLELHAGEGNGISFLNALGQLDIPCYPYVLITTNNINPITHAKVRNSGAGFIMTKSQQDYSAENVIEFLRDMKEYIVSSEVYQGPASHTATTETGEERSKRLARLINRELDLIGLSPKVKGRKYLKEGIQILIQDPPDHSICSLVAAKFEKTDASVERAMQHAINQAWRTMPIEDLNKYYTAYISPQRGVPTNTEFMYFYSEKITNEL